MSTDDLTRSPAWYAAPIEVFLAADSDKALTALVSASPFDVTVAQRDAWRYQLELLGHSLRGVAGWLALEFDIPRLGSRIDIVVISGAALIPIECKIGEASYHKADINQVWDYGLDLKYFHKASESAPIYPVLLASDARVTESCWAPPHLDGVHPPRRANAAALGQVIRDAIRDAQGPHLDGHAWLVAPYSPTPTIVEAARALYSRHSVHAIARHDAGAKNLATTSRTIESIIESASRDGFKAIAFVTGVPGAGKTLVGLNVATRHRRQEDSTHAVFLSGNGPLVKVLREALTRDEWERLKATGIRKRKGEVALKVKSFIQNVHHFRDDGVRTIHSGAPPWDRVVVFDEAQRAWNLQKTEDFMKRRKRLPDFGRSEPQFLMEYMNRHPDWAVIICLVGGGQEINTGEAGITTWLDAVRDHFPAWRVFISPELRDSEYAAGQALQCLQGVAQLETNADLHLSVSMRSFRSQTLSAFVKALLDIDRPHARELLTAILQRYPIVLFRDLDRAKRWTRRQSRGSERFGLVASSGAQRLKPHAVDIRVDVDPIPWFLNSADDIRSSNYLEDAATEYQVQGLELDWVCVTWDADLRFDGKRWSHYLFNATGWRSIRQRERQQYLVNAYRVLLTRARQGMAIFVPPGDKGDPTRTPDFYDSTYEYLRDLGIPVVDE